VAGVEYLTKKTIGTSGIMGMASKKNAHLHVRIVAISPPHAKPIAVPSGMAVKKIESQRPRLLGGALSSIQGGTTV
jgi:hypothetical protein